MTMIKALLKEMEEESKTTRKMLACVPTDKFDWKPHPKSMSVKALATHIAELPSWLTFALTTRELDFAVNPYVPQVINDKKNLLGYFEKNYEEAMQLLNNSKDADLLPSWTMRNGEQIYMVLTKGEMVRHALSQTVHHRAQLGVFLRLLDIPIPGSYGPSADEAPLF